MQVEVLDFYADWCGPCKNQEPIFEDVQDEWDDDDNVQFEKVDIDSNDDVANDYSVRSIPTIVILRDDEEEDEKEVSERFVGVTQEETINEAIEDTLD